MNKLIPVLLIAALGMGCQPDAVERGTLGVLQAAAERGDANAQLALGGLYYSGQGVAQNDAEAAIWIRKAAEQDHLLAKLKMSKLHFEGRGVPQDYHEAVNWIIKGLQGN